MLKYGYIDSSVIVSLAVGDPARSNEAQEWMSECKQVCASEIVVVESQSGLSAKAFPEPRLRVEAEQNLNRILDRLLLYSVQPVVLGHARSLVRQYRQSLGLRSMDAIHLATANLVRQELGHLPDEYEIQYLTADKRQHLAFMSEGHLGRLLN